MHHSGNEPKTSMESTLDAVEESVDSAPKRVPNIPRFESHTRPGSIGIVLPNGVVPKGVTLDDGSIIVFSDTAESVLDVFQTVFHDLFHRGSKVRFTNYANYIKTMLDIATSDAMVRSAVSEWKVTIDGLAKFAGASVTPVQQIAQKVLDSLGLGSIVQFQVERNPAAAGIPVPQGIVPTGGTSKGKVYAFSDNIAVEADAFGLRAPIDNVPSDEAIHNRDNYVLHPRISAVLDVGMVIFHQLFRMGLQYVMHRSDYVSTVKDLAANNGGLQHGTSAGDG